MSIFAKLFGKKEKTDSPAYRRQRAEGLHGLAIRYVTERVDGEDVVIGRGGSLSVRDGELLVFSSGDVVFRAKAEELDTSELMSGDGVILTAADLASSGRVRSVVAYYVYYRA